MQDYLWGNCVELIQVNLTPCQCQVEPGNRVDFLEFCGTRLNKLTYYIINLTM